MLRLFSHSSRGLKAAFMLVPLFGLQMLLTIYRPNDRMPGAHFYECLTHIITNSQVYMTVRVTQYGVCNTTSSLRM